MAWAFGKIPIHVTVELEEVMQGELAAAVLAAVRGAHDKPSRQLTAMDERKDRNRRQRDADGGAPELGIAPANGWSCGAIRYCGVAIDSGPKPKSVATTFSVAMKESLSVPPVITNLKSMRPSPAAVASKSTTVEFS